MKLPKKLERRPRVGDVPVPWVALWSSETDSNFIAPLDLRQPTPALFHRESIGEGRPLFGEMSWWRQRRAVMLGVCQVCAHPLTRRFVALHTAHQEIEIPAASTRWRGRVPLLSEPPCCATCARVTLALCPGVRGRRFVELINATVVACFVAPSGDAEKDRVFAPLGASDFPPRGAVSHLKLAALHYREADLEPWEGAA